MSARPPEPVSVRTHGIQSSAFVVLRASILTLLGVLLLWLSLALSVYFVSEAASPAVARAWWPAGAEAQARAAEALTLDTNAARNRAKAAELSTAALIREPVNVRASRVLAVSRSLGGDTRSAVRLLNYSERLSRRDVPTQLALIEAAVQDNRIDRALIHYDRAMRTSMPSAEILIPVLGGAADDPEVARPLGTLLSRRPVWWTYFFDNYLPRATSPAALGTLLSNMRLDRTKELEAAYLSRGLTRLVELDAYPVAARLYKASGGRQTDALVKDGNFDRQGALTPFDWALADDDNRRGVREQRVESLETSLSLEGNTGGSVAKQIIQLAPGTYRLSAIVGDVGSGDGQPRLSISCYGGGEIARLVFPATEAPRRIATTFVYAQRPNCASQWLSVDIGASLDRPLASPWIDDIALTRLR